MRPARRYGKILRSPLRVKTSKGILDRETRSITCVTRLDSPLISPHLVSSNIHNPPFPLAEFLCTGEAGWTSRLDPAGMPRKTYISKKTPNLNPYALQALSVLAYQYEKSSTRNTSKIPTQLKSLLKSYRYPTPVYLAHALHQGLSQLVPHCGTSRRGFSCSRRFKRDGGESHAKKGSSACNTP